MERSPLVTVAEVFYDELSQILEYEDFVMIQIAGPNGTGKSTLYRDFLHPLIKPSGHALTYINADEIALDMRNSDDQPIGLDQDLARLAQKEADFQREILLIEGQQQSVVFETVFSDTEGHRLNYLRRAQEAGYKVVMIFIAVEDVELSMARVRQRVTEGGHDVPEEKQRERYQRSLNNGKKATEFVDLSLYMDNSRTREGSKVMHKPVAVFLHGDLLQASSAPLPEWFESLFQDTVPQN